MHRASNFRLFSVLLFLLVAFAADAYPQSSCSGGRVDLKVCGAVGDDLANDSPALQAAFDALAAAGGGTLSVPEGRYRLASPVSKNFLDQASVIIRGHGSATVFHFASGPGTTNIAVLGAESLLVENLAFAGTPGIDTDAQVAFSVGSVEKTTFRRTDWYGVASAEAGGAVLSANQTDLLVENSSFRGCAASYWNFVPVVHITDWYSTKFSDTDFIDYGMLHGVYHSKTPQGALAWVYVTNPNSEKEGRALFSRMFFDEGATIAVYTQTAPPAIVRFEHIGTNVNMTDAGVGLKIIGAQHASVTHSYFGFASHSPRNAVEFFSVGTAVVEQTELRDKANRILVDNLTKSLTISNSTVETLDAAAETITLNDSNIATLKLSPASKVTTRSGGKFTADALSLGGGAELTTTSQTGTGSLVLANAPTLTGATLTGATLDGAALSSPTITNPTITNPTITGLSLVSANIGAATAASLAVGGGTPLTTTNQTGTGNLVLSTAPTLTGATLTNPVITGATLSSASLGAAAGASLSLGGGIPLTTTNRTGTGNLVLANSPTLANATLTGPVISNATITGATLSGVTLTTPNLGVAAGASLALGGGTPLTTTNRTGTGSLAMSNSPSFVTPNLGAAQAASLAVGGGAPLTSSAQTGTGSLVLSAAPTIASPLISAPTISGRVARTVVGLAAGAADPSVAAGDVFQVANPHTTSINDFRDGAEGQLIFLVFSDTNTTVVDGPGLRLRGDFNSKPDAVLILLRVGSAWIEISRSIDTKPFAAPKLDKAEPLSKRRP